MVLPLPEFNNENQSINAIAEGLRAHGCALLRRALAPELVRMLLARAQAAFTLRDEQYRTNSLPAGYDAALFLSGNVPFTDMDAPGEKPYTALMSLIAHSPLPRLLGVYFSDKIAFPVSLCTPRRQSVSSVNKPVPFHQDAGFYPLYLGQNYELVNAWIPLTACGVDAPSLEVLPQRLHEEIMPTPRGDGELYDPIHIPEAEVFSRFGGAALWHPEFDPGDIMLMTTYTLHRTWQLPHMPKMRYSLEVRAAAAGCGIALDKCLIIKGAAAAA